MLPPFPAQFFILLGIYFFLGGSIIIIMFDGQFPTGLPYILDFAALVGFIQLVLTPQYLDGYPTEVQFYYCTAYAVVAVLAVLGSNLYVAFVRGQRMIGSFFAVAATIPSILSSAFFTSAYVNNVSVTLPYLPLLPWPVIWGAFFAASAIIALAMVAVTYRKDDRRSRTILDLEQRSKALEQTVDALHKQKCDLEGEISEMGPTTGGEGQQAGPEGQGK